MNKGIDPVYLCSIKGCTRKHLPGRKMCRKCTTQRRVSQNKYVRSMQKKGLCMKCKLPLDKPKSEWTLGARCIACDLVRAGGNRSKRNAARLTT